jgi:hypothetical protein
VRDLRSKGLIEHNIAALFDFKKGSPTFTDQGTTLRAGWRWRLVVNQKIE